MKNNFYSVIMAGGIGSRFWPVSTKKKPKQFHDMLGTGKSLIQNTFERINTIVPTNNILIATNLCYEKKVLKQLSKIKKNQLILEPEMRNTAPCILYSALKINKKNPNAIILIAPSDHCIIDEHKFLRNIKTAFDICSKNDILMTLGIKPDHPNTGYGYIKYENSIKEVKKVKQFIEKPNIEKANKFILNDLYLWNSGIFIWSVKSILKAFKEYLPNMFEILEKGSKMYNTDLEYNFINSNYKNCENISIDYGIMEQAKNVKVLPVNFGWSDLGTWNSLYNKLKKDDNFNAVIGSETIFNNSTGNIVRTKKGKKVIIQNLENYIIVEEDDILLICPRKNDQEIKQILNQAKNTFTKDNLKTEEEKQYINNV